ncbi:unnamed protein product [Parnassius apollo]|uniref:(apollo) hypothetical protein n=1 Tax=Parnassius apollo TaxID=110799 RepID=A0A8S3X561_PARAO|nr:unnamed protein product [Parnassius apollo]
MELCSVPSPALHVEVGGSGTSTPNRTPTSRKRNASDHNDMGAKRRLITSSSSSSRPLRDIEISNALNYGSDEDSEEDGEEEIGLQSTIVPRVDSFQREFSINVWAGVIGNKLVDSHILPDNFNGLKLSGVYDKRLANVAI